MENIILRNYLDDLKNGLDVFYKEYERSIDPTSFLISKKAKWLFESDIIYSKILLLMLHLLCNHFLYYHL